MTFKEARDKMAQELREDPGLRLGYVANIAMLLYDLAPMDDPTVTAKWANDAAEKLIVLIFESGDGNIALPEWRTDTDDDI